MSRLSAFFHGIFQAASWDLIKWVLLTGGGVGVGLSTLLIFVRDQVARSSWEFIAMGTWFLVSLGLLIFGLVRSASDKKTHRRLTKMRYRIKNLNATVSEVVLPFTNHHRSVTDVVAQIKFTRWRGEEHTVDYGAWDMTKRRQRVDFYHGDTLELTVLRIDRNDKPVRLYTINRKDSPPGEHSWMIGGVPSYTDYLRPLFTPKPEWIKDKIKITVTLVGRSYRQVFKYTLIQSADGQFRIED